VFADERISLMDFKNFEDAHSWYVMVREHMREVGFREIQSQRYLYAIGVSLISRAHDPTLRLLVLIAMILKLVAELSQRKCLRSLWIHYGIHLCQ